MEPCLRSVFLPPDLLREIRQTSTPYVFIGWFMDLPGFGYTSRWTTIIYSPLCCQAKGSHAHTHTLDMPAQSHYEFEIEDPFDAEIRALERRTRMLRQEAFAVKQKKEAEDGAEK